MKNKFHERQMNVVMQNLNFKPLSDFVLLDPIEITETAGGLHLPSGVNPDDLAKARVIAAGPGRTTNDGKVLPMPLEVGDVVYRLTRNNPMVIQLNGKQYAVASAGEVIAKVPRE